MALNLDVTWIHGAVYPRLLVVNDWPAYRGSARRLHAFVQSHDITCFLGAHIEMRRSPRELFPLGTIFQPDEHPLQLRRADLLQWATLCDRLGDDGVGQHASGSFVIDIQ